MNFIITIYHVEIKQIYNTNELNVLFRLYYSIYFKRYSLPSFYIVSHFKPDRFDLNPSIPLPFPLFRETVYSISAKG